jgi:catechol 2,3-dioxygenase-like lactoylglutathione lyase family enzyme
MARSTPPDADAPLDPRRPAIVSLAVRDLPRALAFWHGTLGLPVKLRTRDRAELQSETCALALVEAADAPAPSDAVVIGFEVDDLEAAAAWLAARGVALEPASERGTDGGRRRAFRDPDGHRLELVAYR